MMLVFTSMKIATETPVERADDLGIGPHSGRKIANRNRRWMMSLLS